MGLPIASQYSQEILSLPMYPEMTKEMVEIVAEKLKIAVGSVSVTQPV